MRAKGLAGAVHLDHTRALPPPGADILPWNRRLWEVAFWTLLLTKFSSALLSLFRTRFRARGDYIWLGDLGPTFYLLLQC